MSWQKACCLQIICDAAGNSWSFLIVSLSRRLRYTWLILSSNEIVMDTVHGRQDQCAIRAQGRPVPPQHQEHPWFYVHHEDLWFVPASTQQTKSACFLSILSLIDSIFSASASWYVLKQGGKQNVISKVLFDLSIELQAFLSARLWQHGLDRWQDPNHNSTVQWVFYY